MIKLKPKTSEDIVWNLVQKIDNLPAEARKSGIQEELAVDGAIKELDKYYASKIPSVKEIEKELKEYDEWGNGILLNSYAEVIHNLIINKQKER